MPISTAPTEKIQGHWLLAKLGKKILRPGGRKLSARMIQELNISSTDRVIEFAPGMGATAKVLLSHQPASYTAIERDDNAVETTRKIVEPHGGQVVQSLAQQSPLPGGEASIVVGEAMLTMQNDSNKANVISEAARLLEVGGRYAIHELCLVPDNISAELADQISLDLSRSIHVGAKPLTVGGWRNLLEENGFKVISEHRQPMALLAPKRVIEDEGLFPALKFFGRVATDKAARARVRSMHKCFVRWQSHFAGVAFIAEKVA